MSDSPAYGLWALVVINSLVFIFAFSFTLPRTGRDWRAFGGFAAFVIALFTEMYALYHHDTPLRPPPARAPAGSLGPMTACPCKPPGEIS